MLSSAFQYYFLKYSGNDRLLSSEIHWFRGYQCYGLSSPFCLFGTSLAVVLVPIHSRYSFGFPESQSTLTESVFTFKSFPPGDPIKELFVSGLVLSWKLPQFSWKRNIFIFESGFPLPFFDLLQEIRPGERKGSFVCLSKFSNRVFSTVNLKQLFEHHSSRVCSVFEHKDDRVLSVSVMPIWPKYRQHIDRPFHRQLVDINYE